MEVNFLLPVFLLAISSAAASERPTNEPSEDSQIRHAVQRSTKYLEKEGAAWMKQQRCASCHHIPAMVWALNEARNHGYPVNEKLLGDVTSWALAAENHDQVFPDLPLDSALPHLARWPILPIQNRAQRGAIDGTVTLSDVLSRYQAT